MVVCTLRKVPRTGILPLKSPLRPYRALEVNLGWMGGEDVHLTGGLREGTWKLINVKYRQDKLLP